MLARVHGAPSACTDASGRTSPYLGPHRAVRQLMQFLKYVLFVSLPQLVLKENGIPVMLEEGEPRDVMLMPTSEGRDDAEVAKHQQLGLGQGAEAQEILEGATPLDPVSDGPRLDYQVMCHFDCPEATQILRLPVVLPRKESGEFREG